MGGGGRQTPGRVQGDGHIRGDGNTRRPGSNIPLPHILARSASNGGFGMGRLLSSSMCVEEQRPAGSTSGLHSILVVKERKADCWDVVEAGKMEGSLGIDRV